MGQFLYGELSKNPHFNSVYSYLYLTFVILRYVHTASYLGIMIAKGIWKISDSII